MADLNLNPGIADALTRKMFLAATDNPDFAARQAALPPMPARPTPSNNGPTTPALAPMGDTPIQGWPNTEGREIDPNMLQKMSSSMDPATALKILTSGKTGAYGGAGDFQRAFPLQPKLGIDGGTVQALAENGDMGDEPEVASMPAPPEQDYLDAMDSEAMARKLAEQDMARKKQGQTAPAMQPNTLGPRGFPPR